MADGSNITLTSTLGASNPYSAGVNAVAASGAVAVQTEQNTSIKTVGNYISGIRINSGNNGGVILNDGAIETSGLQSFGIWAMGSAGIGELYIVNNGTVNTSGNLATGIYANNNSSELTTVINNGSIINNGANAGAIKVASAGEVYIENTGILTAKGQGSYGINATTTTGDIIISNSGIITSEDDRGIFARTNSSNVIVQATNDITTTQSGNMHNHGIDAAITTGIGIVRVDYDDGTIKVVGNTLSGGNAIGITAWDNNSGNAGVESTINLGANGVIDATQGVGGIQIRSNGTGTVNIAQGGKVHGGSNDGYGIEFRGISGANAAVYQLNNHGLVDSMNDQFLKLNAVAGSSLEINNYGTLEGYLRAVSGDITFNNYSANSWNIRNFSDADGDGTRDTKAVAISDFGTGYGVFNNEANGVVRLATVSEDTLPAVTTGEYVADGALSISNAGTVHGHLMNLNQFENRGVVDLSANGQAGDVLLISGGSTAGTYGGGAFVADGGFVLLDVVLNEGGANSVSDVLVLDDVVKGSESTRVVINRVDGLGGVTNGDGIKVIEVLGSMDDGAFVLNQPVKGGVYEYTLHQGSLTNLADRSAYLRSTYRQINPDIGSYLANQTAATGLFMHSLHDRLGEPQYYENGKSEGRAIPAIWLRTSFGHFKNDAANGNLRQSTDKNVIHLGGEIANWTSNGDNRYHLGLMGAYGKSETKTTSKATGTKVDSKVDGYGVGAYLTWYNNESAPEGWYADVWSMYNWFDNETEGSDNYDSKSWNTSVEVGYAAKLQSFENYHWMIEPQAQVAYNYYSASDIKDRNGLTITDTDANGFTTRLGMRTYLRPSTQPNSLQPFFETNWLYNSANNSMSFNNAETLSDDTPENRFEVKTGVQGEVIKNLQVYGHVGFQWGQNSYENSEGQIGLRYRF